jgi:hypothetical protein
MELDIFIPDLNLALEYQGAQHYESIFPFGDRGDRTERDKEKREACLKVRKKKRTEQTDRKKNLLGRSHVGGDTLLVGPNERKPCSYNISQQT